MKRSAPSIRGFTLIELLVVIAIIGILSSVVLASLNSARQKARDSRRIADLKQIQTALELYYDTYRAYPSTSATAANQAAHTIGTWGGTGNGNPASFLDELVTRDYMPSVVQDPTNASGAWPWQGPTAVASYYFYMSNGQKYILGAWLENRTHQNNLDAIDKPNPFNTSQMLHADVNYSGYVYVLTP